MAPIPKEKLPEAVGTEYDLLVIGGGSGGMGVARRAAKYGAKVAVIEGLPVLGGTCVNVGCVPKKIMWYVADHAEKLKNSKDHGFNVPGLDDGHHSNLGFNWGALKTKRDAYIHRLNGIYDRNLEKEKIDYFSGWASFKSASELLIKPNEIEGKEDFVLKGKHIVIAVGGAPTVPKDIEGAEYGITSDGFFDLKEQPKRVAVVGAGYISVELAGIFNTLGSETHLIIRQDKFLRTFDPIISDTLMGHMDKTGLAVHKSSNVKKVVKESSGALTLTLDTGKTLEVDCLLWAIGRHPLTEALTVKNAGIELDKKGDVVVNEYQETNVKGVYAIGDVAGKALLTPVAIAAGRRLSNRLFGGPEFKDDKLSYDLIPSVIFSHPTSGSVGLTEAESREKYGDDKIKIYSTKFTGMSNSMLSDNDKKSPTAMKMVCLLPDLKILGVHIVGEGSDEMMQFIGVAVKMGATKKDFDDTVAIHPTSGEELVTMV